jgi:hypothetical protein
MLPREASGGERVVPEEVRLTIYAVISLSVLLGNLSVDFVFDFVHTQSLRRGYYCTLNVSLTSFFGFLRLFLPCALLAYSLVKKLFIHGLRSSSLVSAPLLLFIGFPLFLLNLHAVHCVCRLLAPWPELLLQSSHVTFLALFLFCGVWELRALLMLWTHKVDFFCYFFIDARIFHEDAHKKNLHWSVENAKQLEANVELSRNWLSKEKLPAIESTFRSSASSTCPHQTMACGTLTREGICAGIRARDFKSCLHAQLIHQLFRQA